MYSVAKNDPELQGLEPAALLGKSFIKYNLTYLMGLQLCALIAEAALLGSVVDEKTNVAVRMFLHLVMAAISTISAFGLSKAFGEFVYSFVMIPKRPVGITIGLMFSTAVLTFIAFFFAIGAPIFNMLALANALHNTVQLDVFMAALQVQIGLEPQAYLDYIIKINHLPEDYAPFASLHSGMVSSLGITLFHLILTFWEIVYTLKLALESKSLLDSILNRTIGLDDKDGKENKDGKKDKKKEKKEKTAEGKSQIEDLLKFIGLSDKDVTAWVDKLLIYLDEATHDGKIVSQRVVNLGGLHFQMDSLSNNGGKKTADGTTPEKLVEKIRKEFEQNWASSSITLPKPKAKNA
jgi:hypothetical protein